MKFLRERQSLNTWRFYADDTDRFEASVVCFEQPSPFGIDGGRISKLFIQDKSNGKFVCSYDRTWNVKPTSDVKAFYEEILNTLN